MSELFKLEVGVIVERNSDDREFLGKYIFKGLMAERGDKLVLGDKTYMVLHRLFREDGIFIVVAEDAQSRVVLAGAP